MMSSKPMARFGASSVGEDGIAAEYSRRNWAATLIRYQVDLALQWVTYIPAALHGRSVHCGLVRRERVSSSLW